jgi:hypothetical protein
MAELEYFVLPQGNVADNVPGSWQLFQWRAWSVGHDFLCKRLKCQHHNRGR